MAIKGTDVYGNVSVGRNVAAGGNARVNGNIRVGHNLKVEGWLEAPNIKDVNKGVFRTLAELQAAYPDPKAGWFAGVGASTPFAAYEAVDGDWVATGGTIDVNVDLAHYDSLLDDHGEAIGNLESGMANAERNIDLLSVLSRSGYRIGGFIGPNNSYLAKAVEGSCYVGMAYGSASWADGVSGRVWLPPTGWSPQGESVKPSSVSGWTSVDLSSSAYNGYVVLFGFRDGKWVVHRLPYALKEKVDSLAGIWDTYVGRISENESGIRRIEELLTNYNTYLSSAVRFSGDKTVVRAGEESQVNFTFDTDLDFEGTATLELYADGLLVGTYTIESADQLPYTFSRDVDGSCLFTLRAHIGAQEFMSVWHVSAGHDFYVGAGPDYSSVLSDASARRSGDTDMGGTYSLFAMEGDRVYVICPVTDVVSDVKMSGFLFPMELEQTVYVEGVRYAVYRSANTMQRGEIDITINDVEFDKGGFITHLIAKMQDVVDASIGTEEMVKSIADEETITVTENNKVALKNRPMRKSATTGEIIQKGYVILKEGDDFKTVVESYTEGNVIFEINYAFDLDGQSVAIPEGCTLKFDGGSLSNGTLNGNYSSVVAANSVIFNNVNIIGEWQASIAYLSWFADSENDDTALSIQNCISLSDKVVLNKQGVIKSSISISRNVEIDGCGNTFNVDWKSSSESAIINNSVTCCDISLHDVKFIYNSVVITNASSVYAIWTKFTANNVSTLDIYNVEISGFDNRESNPCGFTAIKVQRFNKDASFTIHDINIHDNIVLGDGTVGNADGANYGIVIQSATDAESSGVGSLYNITISNIANANPSDTSDLTFDEDSTGIYILTGASSYNTKMNVSIHDCYFNNCGGRCFKIQGNYINIRNIYNHLDIEGSFIVNQNNVIDIQGKNGNLENFKGDVQTYFLRFDNANSKGKFVLKNAELNLQGGSYFARIKNGNGVYIENSQIDINGTYSGFINGAITGNDDLIISIKDSVIQYGNEVSPSGYFMRYSSTNNRVVSNILIENSEVYFNQLSYNTNHVSKLYVRNSKLLFNNTKFLDAIDAEDSEFTGLSANITGNISYLLEFSTAEATVTRRWNFKNCLFNYHSLGSSGLTNFYTPKEALVKLDRCKINILNMGESTSFGHRFTLNTMVIETIIKDVITEFNDFRLSANKNGGTLVLENMTISATGASTTGTADTTPLKIKLIDSTVPLGTFAEFLTNTELSGTTSIRTSITNKLISSQAGLRFYDTDLKKYVLWNGGAWTNLDGTALS